jgi:hypothetical protein
MRVRTIEAVSNALASRHSDPRTFTFLKEDKAWYIDLPDYVKQGGLKKDLEMVAGAGELLTWLARRRNQVTITIDTEPFEGAQKLELLELCDHQTGGGYYRLHTCRGREIKKRMWLCDVALFIFGDIPEQIYLRKGAFQLNPQLQ